MSISSEEIRPSQMSRPANSPLDEELEVLSIESRACKSPTVAVNEDRRLSHIEKEERGIAMLDIDAPGHLNNLSANQRELLFGLWALILEYFSNNSYYHSSANQGGYPKSSEEDFFITASCSKQNWELANSIKASLNSSKFVESRSSLESVMSLEKSEHTICKHPLSQEFWAQLAADDPDVMLLRFLRARRWNLTDAFSMYLECLKWNRRFGVQRIMYLGESVHRHELFTCGKGFFWGIDRHQRLVIYLTARLHNRHAQTLQETMNMTVFQIEQGRRLFQPGTETVVVVFDLQDAPLSSLDFGGMQFMISCFQGHYPECLSRVLVLNAPWIFWGFWSIVRPLLDPVVQKKIVFVDDVGHLKTFISEDMLLEKFGGKCPYHYEYVPPPHPDTEAEASSTLKSGSSTAEPLTPTSMSDSNFFKSPSTSLSLSEREHIPPKGPIRLTDQQVLQIHKLLDERWKPAFLEATLHLCALKGDDTSMSFGRSSINQWKELRQKALKNCQRLLRRLELHYCPDNMYHRIGVIHREIVPGSGLEDGFEDYEMKVTWKC